MNGQEMEPMGWEDEGSPGFLAALVRLRLHIVGVFDGCIVPHILVSSVSVASGAAFVDEGVFCPGVLK
jgi:hypothetical protein